MKIGTKKVALYFEKLKNYGLFEYVLGQQHKMTKKITKFCFICEPFKNPQTLFAYLCTL